MKRLVTTFVDSFTGSQFYRAHVWDQSGYSTKTFATHAEAASWLPTWPRIVK